MDTEQPADPFISGSARRSKALQALLLSLGLHAMGAALFRLLPEGGQARRGRGGSIQTVWVSSRKIPKGGASAPVAESKITDERRESGAERIGAGAEGAAKADGGAKKGDGGGDGMDNEMEAGEAVVMIGDAKPVYPVVSRRQGEQGEAVLLLRIGGGGQVLSVTLDKSSGYARLDEAAIEFAKKSLFRIPPTLEPPVRKRLAVLFQLD